MPKLPNAVDPTLAAADMAMVATQDRYKRKYLGMSSIGEPCERKLWYSFRHALTVTFDAPTLKRFEDGHRTEDLVIARLRRVDGLAIVDRGGDGRQLGAKLLGAHFAGHYDFMAQGLLQAPKTWHVGEVKCTAKLSELEKHVSNLGEKNALQEWNVTYYGQAQMYMDYEGVERHWLVATTPGGREWTSVRTDYDPLAAMKLKAKAERIIFSETAPGRIGEETSFACKWCDYHGLCHGDTMPERSCRNCVHATALPVGNADWRCEKGLAFGMVCEHHRFLPTMINGVQRDVIDGAIVYELANGREFRDAGGNAG